MPMPGQTRLTPVGAGSPFRPTNGDAISTPPASTNDSALLFSRDTTLEARGLGAVLGRMFKPLVREGIKRLTDKGNSPSKPNPTPAPAPAPNKKTEGRGRKGPGKIRGKGGRSGHGRKLPDVFASWVRAMRRKGAHGKRRRKHANQKSHRRHHKQ